MTEIYQVGEPVELEYNGFPLVVCFTNPVTCAPCKLFAPHFQKAADKFGDRASFAEVDILENMSIAEKFGVTRTPTVLLIDENGTTDVQGRTTLALDKELDELLPN